MARSFEMALAQPRHRGRNPVPTVSPIAAELDLRDAFFPGRGRLEEADPAACAGSSPRSKEKGRSTPRGAARANRSSTENGELPMPMLGHWPSKTAPWGN